MPNNIGKTNLDGTKQYTGMRLWIRDIPDQILASQSLNTYLLQATNSNMNVNGSSTPVSYIYTVPAGKCAFIVRSFITLEDGIAALSPGDFGAISGALSNGVQINLNGSEIANWKTNREIRNTMFDFDEQFGGAGSYVGRWTHTRDYNGNPLFLDAGETFECKIRDDLTDLDQFLFRLKGIVKDIPKHLR